jgi:hypothetical protein
MQSNVNNDESNHLTLSDLCCFMTSELFSLISMAFILGPGEPPWSNSFTFKKIPSNFKSG